MEELQLVKCQNDELYQKEIVALERVISALRGMLISGGVKDSIIDAVEEEAYLND